MSEQHPIIIKELEKTVKKVMSGNRGILAADERPESANKNLKKAGIEPTDEIRRKYRELFINTPDIEKYINAIIISDETFWQKDSNGILFRETLSEKGIQIVIKVDEGTVNLPGFPKEKITLGLDDLEDRLINYYKNGATLAKWRSVIKIGENLPTEAAIEANALALAEYALFCQKTNIVPIVEPEVLIDGDHSIEQAEKVTKNTLKTVFRLLTEYKVYLPGLILKTSMVVPGSDNKTVVSEDIIAEATVRTLLETVPKNVGGIVFLSGGQTGEEATYNFNAIAKADFLPWELTFSFLRAILGEPTCVWAGKDENVEEARKLFIKILKRNSLADSGSL